MELADSFADLKRTIPDSALRVLDTLRPRENMPDSRGFAWYVLDRFCRPEVKSLATLPNAIKVGAYRRDGRMIALADEANNTYVVDPATGKSRKLPGESKLTLCWSLWYSRQRPDGRTLASHSSGRTEKEGRGTEVRLWNLESGAPLEGMPASLARTYQILFSPDGGTLVTVEAVEKATQIRRFDPGTSQTIAHASHSAKHCAAMSSRPGCRAVAQGPIPFDGPSSSATPSP